MSVLNPPRVNVTYVGAATHLDQKHKNPKDTKSELKLLEKKDVEDYFRVAPYPPSEHIEAARKKMAEDRRKPEKDRKVATEQVHRVFNELYANYYLKARPDAKDNINGKKPLGPYVPYDVEAFFKRLTSENTEAVEAANADDGSGGGAPAKPAAGLQSRLLGLIATSTAAVADSNPINVANSKHAEEIKGVTRLLTTIPNFFDAKARILWDKEVAAMNALISANPDAHAVNADILAQFKRLLTDQKVDKKKLDAIKNTIELREFCKVNHGLIEQAITAEMSKLISAQPPTVAVEIVQKNIMDALTAHAPTTTIRDAIDTASRFLLAANKSQKDLHEAVSGTKTKVDGIKKQHQEAEDYIEELKEILKKAGIQAPGRGGSSISNTVVDNTLFELQFTMSMLSTMTELTKGVAQAGIDTMEQIGSAIADINTIGSDA